MKAKTLQGLAIVSVANIGIKQLKVISSSDSPKTCVVSAVNIGIEHQCDQIERIVTIRAILLWEVFVKLR